MSAVAAVDPKSVGKAITEHLIQIRKGKGSAEFIKALNENLNKTMFGGYDCTPPINPKFLLDLISVLDETNHSQVETTLEILVSSKYPVFFDPSLETVLASLAVVSGKFRPEFVGVSMRLVDLLEMIYGRPIPPKPSFLSWHKSEKLRGAISLFETIHRESKSSKTVRRIRNLIPLFFTEFSLVPRKKFSSTYKSLLKAVLSLDSIVGLDFQRLVLDSLYEALSGAEHLSSKVEFDGIFIDFVLEAVDLREPDFSKIQLIFSTARAKNIYNIGHDRSERAFGFFASVLDTLARRDPLEIKKHLSIVVDIIVMNPRVVLADLQKHLPLVAMLDVEDTNTILETFKRLRKLEPVLVGLSQADAPNIKPAFRAFCENSLTHFSEIRSIWEFLLDSAQRRELVEYLCIFLSSIPAIKDISTFIETYERTLKLVEETDTSDEYYMSLVSSVTILENRSGFHLWFDHRPAYQNTFAAIDTFEKLETSLLLIFRTPKVPPMELRSMMRAVYRLSGTLSKDESVKILGILFSNFGKISPNLKSSKLSKLILSMYLMQVRALDGTKVTVSTKDKVWRESAFSLFMFRFDTRAMLVFLSRVLRPRLTSQELGSAELVYVHEMLFYLAQHLRDREHRKFVSHLILREFQQIYSNHPKLLKLHSAASSRQQLFSWMYTIGKDSIDTIPKEIPFTHARTVLIPYVEAYIAIHRFFGLDSEDLLVLESSAPAWARLLVDNYNQTIRSKFLRSCGRFRSFVRTVFASSPVPGEPEARMKRIIIEGHLGISDPDAGGGSSSLDLNDRVLLYEFYDVECSKICDDITDMTLLLHRVIERDTWVGLRLFERRIIPILGDDMFKFRTFCSYAATSSKRDKLLESLAARVSPKEYRTKEFKKLLADVLDDAKSSNRRVFPSLCFRLVSNRAVAKLLSEQEVRSILLIAKRTIDAKAPSNTVKLVYKTLGGLISTRLDTLVDNYFIVQEIINQILELACTTARTEFSLYYRKLLALLMRKNKRAQSVYSPIFLIRFFRLISRSGLGDGSQVMRNLMQGVFVVFDVASEQDLYHVWHSLRYGDGRENFEKYLKVHKRDWKFSGKEI